MPQMSASSSNPIGDVIVQLTGSPEDENRLAVASEIGEGFGAHLIGVHLHVLPDILDITDPMRSATIRELLEASDREADEAFKSLQPQLDALPGSHELLRLHGLAVDVAKDLAAITRSADLFIGTRPYGDPEGRYRIEEEVLFGGGRGCLFLPPGGTPHHRFDTIVIAWDGSREAARAVAEAMPLLVRASAVRLLHVLSAADDPKIGERELSRIAQHLRHHGMEPESAVVPFVNSTGEAIESFAHQQNAHLLVMGAYGHPRLIEFVFGGATRYILRHATLPVLMAH